MRLPWVSRSHFDLLQHSYAEMAAEWRTQRTFHAAEQKRFDVLLEKYHALKLQGATAPDSVVPRTAKEIDPLVQAVNAQCAGKPPQIRMQMMKQLAADRKALDAGLITETEILHRIESGFETDDGVPI